MTSALRIGLGSAVVLAAFLAVYALGWLLPVWDWLRVLDPRIWQAVIAGVFVAAGWLVNGWQNRRAAAKLRAERLRDAHRAIFAEIDSNLSNLLDEGQLRQSAARVARRMRRDAGFVPFISRERHDRIFKALEAEIHVLPRVTIDPIVAYYSQLEALAAHVDDMRSDRFQTLESPRRVRMYLDQIYMKIAALRLGRKANYLIKLYAEKGKDAAEAEAQRLSGKTPISTLPAADRSGQ